MMPLIMIGAGGHAKVAIETWRSAGGQVLALYDDSPDLLGREVLGVRVEGPARDALRSGQPLHIAIGDNLARSKLSGLLLGANIPALVHAKAHVSPSATIGAGSLICAGAIVQAAASVGRHAIVNSQALIEHDVEVADFCHIAPGVRLGGAAKIESGAFVGIGAVVLPGIVIGERAIVGAGSVVIRDVERAATVVGNPARRIAR